MLRHKGAIVVAEMRYAQEVKPPELAGRELGMLLSGMVSSTFTPTSVESLLLF